MGLVLGNTYRSRQHRKGKNSRGFYNKLVYVLSRRAAKRKIAWELSQDEVLKLIKQNCYLCGAQPANRFKSPNKEIWQGRVIIYQGIDRVDNDRGYVVDNVKPCCKRCNLMKTDMSLTGLKKHIKRIVKFGSIKIGVSHANFRSKSPDKARKRFI